MRCCPCPPKNKKVPPAPTAIIQATINNLTAPAPQTDQDQKKIDVPPSAPQTQRKNWNSITASVGQDQAFKQVRDFLRNDEIGMVGIYGMGGVGKTTLLEKIRDEYLKPFDFKVIWIVVSKSLNVDSIQKDVMKKMDLDFDPSEHSYNRAEQISNSLDQISNSRYENKVALLFDDIWEPLDLKKLGILGPTGRDKSIFKIIFTTRSEQVCDQMEPDGQIKVECLEWDESWALFEKIVGRNTIAKETIAIEIAKECKGLPLALTVIGLAVKWKKDRRQWEDALVTLQKSSTEDPYIKEQLFDRMKLSYDNLSDNGEKNCFLYCCLFPEDEIFESDQLIEYWIAEGFLALSSSYLEVSKRGVNIIGILKAACLLERVDGDIYVKMHDVVRDMGLWIASTLTSWNFFIHGGSQLLKSEIEEKWREAHRIYVRRGDGFPEHPLCPNLTTLIIDLALGEQIEIWNSFFNSMGKLRVLKLKNVDFGNEKVEIGQLLELRYLSVRKSNLRTCPTDVIKLSKLEVLDLRENKRLKGVPENSIRHLVELRKLTSPTIVPCFDAVIVAVGHPSKLEIFNMRLDDEGCVGQFAGPLAGPDFSKLVIFTSGFLPSLKTLQISHCYGLEKIQVRPRAFENIRELEIRVCFSLKCIVGLEHLRRTLVKLIIEWGKMEELWMEVNDGKIYATYYEMEGGAAATAALSFPTLTYMKLKNLAYLKSICSDDVQFPSLTTFILEECTSLKKLPRGLMNEKRTLKECRIEGDREWWSGLMWQDDGFKSFIESTLTPHSRKEILSS